MDSLYFNPKAKPLQTKNFKWSYKRHDQHERTITFLSENYHSLQHIFAHIECFTFSMICETDNEECQAQALWKNYERTLENTIYRVPWLKIRDKFICLGMELDKENFDVAMRQFVEYFSRRTLKFVCSTNYVVQNFRREC